MNQKIFYEAYKNFHNGFIYKVNLMILINISKSIVTPQAFPRYFQFLKECSLWWVGCTQHRTWRGNGDKLSRELTCYKKGSRSPGPAVFTVTSRICHQARL